MPIRFFFSLWMAALLLLHAFLGGVTAMAQGQGVQAVPQLTGRVIDQLGLLSPAEHQALEQQLASLEAKHGSQMVVLIVASTAPEEIAQYAHRVADSWKLGRKEQGDGLLLVVARDDRLMRLEVARALEGVIPDLMAARILDKQLAPAFRAEKYAEGLREAILKIEQLIAKEATREEPRQSAVDFSLDAQDVLTLVVLVMVLSRLLRAFLRRLQAGLTLGGIAGVAGWWLTGSWSLALIVALTAAVYSGFFVRGSRSRHDDDGSNDGGGGFQSGGGGSFGGGGATGRW